MKYQNQLRLKTRMPGAALPDLDLLQADACAPTDRYDSHTRLVLERKLAYPAMRVV